MIRFLTLLGLSAFIATAVFGALAMMSDDMNHASCFAAVINGGECLGVSPIAVALYHLQAAARFSLAVMTGSVFSLFMAAALLALAMMTFGAQGMILPAITLRREQLQPVSHRFRQTFLHWFSLLETSPNVT